MIYDLSDLFEPMPPLGLTQAPYTPLPIEQSTDELSIGLLGTLSSFLGQGRRAADPGAGVEGDRFDRLQG